MVLKQAEKGFDVSLQQELNLKIVSCKYYSSKYVGEIWCRQRRQFVMLADCKVCVVGRVE